MGLKRTMAAALNDRWDLGDPAISARVREVGVGCGDGVRGAMESLEFEVSSLRWVGYEAPKAVAPNEPISPQTKCRDWDKLDWKGELSTISDAASAGQEVERPRPWFGRWSGVWPQCQSLAANRQSLTTRYLRLTTYCLRLFLVRGRAVRYDL